MQLLRGISDGNKAEPTACTRTIVPFSDAVAMREPGGRSGLQKEHRRCANSKRVGLGQLASNAMAAMGESSRKLELSTGAW